MWAKIVHEKYGDPNSIWKTKVPKDSYGVSIWRHINSVADMLFGFIQFKIGNGNSIRLWEDKRCSGGILAFLCPNLYAITTVKNIKIVQAFSVNEAGTSCWDLGLSNRRRLYDVEIQELTILFPILDTIQIKPDEDDEMVWIGHKTGTFSVKSAYNLEIQEIGCDPYFSSRRIWSSNWPMNHGFFLWKAVLNRLSTLTNLQRRGSATISTNGTPIANVCIFCRQCEEDSNHLFLH